MIIERFRQQVRNYPGKLAVKTHTKSFTYRELDKLSDGIANKIRAITGNRSERAHERFNIGVLLDSGADMIAAILGVLKSGNAYVPLVAEFPMIRINFIIQHAEIEMFITDNKNKDRVSTALKEKKPDCILIENINREKPCDLPDITDTLTFTRDICRDSDAYLLYTSGSTGFPKGVRQTHRNILHSITQYTKNLELTGSDNFTLFSSFSHDAAVMDIYGALLNGGTLFPLDLKLAGVFSTLAQWLKTEKITVWHSVPTVYRYFIAAVEEIVELPDLRFVVLGGEAVLRSDIERFQSLFPVGCRLYNLYGQTESSYNSGQFFDVGQQGNDNGENDASEKEITITLGEPVQGTELAVVDEQGDEKEPLEVGEIIVISDHVSPGYWKEEQTGEGREQQEQGQEKFIIDPEAGRIYFTGDLGCRLPDGKIQYLGRKDHQVKLRGYRVELGEIESTVLQYNYIEQAAVIPVESLSPGSNEIFLACYFSAGKDIDMQLLRDFLQERLMDYCIPSYFRQLDRLPMTISGKIDRKALPVPTLALNTEYIPPRDEIEKKLVNIWAELLDIGKEVIGIANGFFQLGGHSLKATLLAGKIFKEFNVNISLADVFKRQTINQLSQYIRQATKGNYSGIEPVEKREYYPLSSAQKRMYFLHQLEGIGTTYNMPFLFNLRRSTSREHMEQTCLQLIRRHEILRTSFEIVGQESVQRIHEPDQVDFEMEYAEISPGQEQEIFNWFIRPFDLARAPLMRIGLLKTGSQYTFLADFHHIIVDGISQNLLEADFLAIYEGRPLPEMKVQYKDYTQWQNSERQQEELKKQKEYWLKTLNDELSVLDLPCDFPRPLGQRFEGEVVSFILKENETLRLKELTGQLGATLFMVLLSAYNVLLWRLSSQADIIVGTPIAGRNHPDLQHLVGMLVNMLIIRNYPVASQRFTELLAEVKDHTIAAFENQEFPFDDLVESLTVRRDISRNPVFDVSFNLLDERNYHFDISEEIEQSALIYLKNTSRFDLSLTIVDRGHGLVFRFEYRTRLFKPETMQRIIRYFKNILSVISIDPGLRLADIEILPEKEKQKILEMCNGEEVPYDTGQTIDRLFVKQAMQTPDHIVLEEEITNEEVSCGGIFDAPVEVHLTYGELHKKSLRLAQLLREKAIGYGKGTVVAVLGERSIAVITSILGIVAAGAAYLPIDPGYPQERIEYMLKDSSARVLITTSNLSEEVEKLRSLEVMKNFEIIFIDSHEVPDSLSSQLLSFSSSDFSSLAYIIYTSGSTGRPKGVAVEHQSLANLCHWHNRFYSVSPADIASQYASLGFDASVWEMFPYLAAGARLHIINDHIKADLLQLDNYFARHRISIGFLPTPAAEQYMQLAYSSSKHFLRVLVTGGDKLNTVTEHPYLLYNNYGPTENTVVTTSCLIKDHTAAIPIGKPIHNSQVYILKPNCLCLQPTGVIGELCIAGQGLARGYLNKPELTAEKFLLTARSQNHKDIYFPWYPGTQATKLYKSGDLGRWLPDGNIEFSGRIDQQVKIRGFRVEPAEIENQLNRHPQINESLVITVEQNSETFLCAYFVSNKKIESTGLKDFLGSRLPDFMVPGFFVQLEKIPLTPNGKIDRKALPAPAPETGRRYSPPRHHLEKKLTEIWSEVLGKDLWPASRIGIDDNFFDLGGHSLRAMILVSRLHQELEVKIPLVELFKQPYIRSLAESIRTKEQDRFYRIEPAEKREYYPLSPAQKRLFILQQMDLQGIVYNMPAALVIKGEPDINRLRMAFGRLILEHDSLRTSFSIIAGQPMQRIHKETGFEIECDDHLNKLHAAKAITDFIRPFDLSRPPLLRVGIFKLDDHERLLVVDMHHIISDGISTNILIREFTDYYKKSQNNQPGPAVRRIQYKDYSQWLNCQRDSVYFKKQQAYWLKEFFSDIPCLDLPSDYPRPGVHLFEGSTEGFELTGKQTRQLKQFNQEHDTTLFMTLLALLNLLLSKLSGLEDIVIGSPVANRPHSDLQEILGMFVNTLALRNYPSPGKTFREFLARVKQTSLEAFENQVYPFEELVEKVVVTRDTGRNPLFDVMLVVQNQEQQQLKIPGLTLQPYPFETQVSKFDMTWTVMETNAADRLEFSIVYYTRLFSSTTIQRFWGYFRQILETVLRNPTALLADIEIISPSEKQEILYGFNLENARTGFPGEKTVHQLFREQVEKTPDRIALAGPGLPDTGGDSSSIAVSDSISNSILITYNRLDQLSDQWALLLSETGVKPDTVVAIMMPHCIEMIVGLLAILKAGGAYLPIDPGYPPDRIQYMLTDSSAVILITAGPPETEFNPSSSQRLNFSSSRPTNLAYIIYTSGTTGKPKGSLIRHYNLVRLMTNDNFQFDFDSNDIWTLFHSYCFDFSVWEMYGALLYGGKLLIIPRMTTKDTPAFLDLLKQEKVTVLNQTPSAFYQLITEELKSGKKELYLNYVIFGGEALNPSRLKPWKQRYPGTHLINMYGITETTVHVTYKEILAQDMETPVSCIGLPIPTLTAYVLNRNFNLQPAGIPGELWVGGLGVCQGYMNQPELTAEKFCLRQPGGRFLKKLPPWTPRKNFLFGHEGMTSGVSGGYGFYRTGDLVKLLLNGELEYLERIDNQIKIRGHRIELGEIENLLLKQEDIKDAVVLLKEDQNRDKYLCAYIVPDKSDKHEAGYASLSIHSAHSTKTREYLTAHLPGYMIPSFFVFLEKIPLTANGKINIKALPDPVFQPGESYAAPRSGIEEKLVEIWREVLFPGQSSVSIGIHDDFFQLGGHSLKAINVVNAIHKVFNVQISIRDIFIAPTIAGLAPVVSETETAFFTGIAPLPQQEYYELSYAQARLWVLHKRDPGSPAFNMPERVTFYEKIEEDMIRDVLNHLTARHESLRTYFTEIQGQVVQKVVPQVTLDINMTELTDVEENQRHLRREQLFTEESLIPFNLEKAPLLRVKIVKCSEEEFDLIFTMHHLVSDGWSLEILYREFYQYYQSFKQGRSYAPEPVKVQYKDYAQWHNQLLTNRQNLKDVLEFWKPQLTGAPVLELPYDFPVGDLTGKKSTAYRAVVDPETTEKLKRLARENQVSLFMVLLAGFNILMWQLTGQEDILIGMPGAARQHEDIKNTIGLFVNTLVLRTSIEKDRTFTNYLTDIRAQVIKMLEYQAYPLELVCEELEIQYPVISLFFNMVNTGDSSQEMMPLLEPGLKENVQEAKFPMAFYLVEYRDKIDILCTYFSQLFLPETIEKILQKYNQLLQTIITNPDRHLKEHHPPRKRLNKKLLRGVQGGGFLEKSPPGSRRQE